jgi:hypothetical protein
VVASMDKLLFGILLQPIIELQPPTKKQKLEQEEMMKHLMKELLKKMIKLNQ